MAAHILHTSCFNPYCNGCASRSIGLADKVVELAKVSILIVMDVLLEDVKALVSLKPAVSILIVMDVLLEEIVNDTF